MFERKTDDRRQNTDVRIRLSGDRIWFLTQFENKFKTR
jgi:hypothetical protein